jgi:RNase P subunit RPR2
MTEGVRIVVVHSKPIDENVQGSRSRNIAKIYLENAQGERFLLPENSLLGARVVARHIANGGAIHDGFSSHIFEAIGQLRDLRYFVNTSRRQQFEDATTTEIVEAAVEYYHTLKETLQKLKGQRGYSNYMESFQEIISKEQVEVNEELKGRFIKKTFDQRLESAMPLIAKAYEHKIREAANLLKKVDEFVQGSKRFGLNESDKQMLSLIEFKDSTAFVLKMLENVSTKLAEHDSVLSKFARNMVENWHGASATHKDMASKLVRSYIKEMRSMVREDEEDMPLNNKKSSQFLKLLSKPLPAGPDGSVSADLARVFNDDKLNDAIRSLSQEPHGIDRDVRPLVIVRFLQIAAKPEGKEFELNEMHFISDILTHLKDNEIGKKYADKIDTILQKYPQTNDDEKDVVEPPQQPVEPEQQQPPAPEQPAAPVPAPAPVAPVAPGTPMQPPAA